MLNLGIKVVVPACDPVNNLTSKTLLLLRSGPNGSELPKMSPERAGTWPQLMCCASVL